MTGHDGSMLMIYNILTQWIELLKIPEPMPFGRAAKYAFDPECAQDLGLVLNQDLLPKVNSHATQTTKPV